jgi:hypothetical protein
MSDAGDVTAVSNPQTRFDFLAFQVRQRDQVIDIQV